MLDPEECGPKWKKKSSPALPAREDMALRRSRHTQRPHNVVAHPARNPPADLDTGHHKQKKERSFACALPFSFEDWNKFCSIGGEECGARLKKKNPPAWPQAEPLGTTSATVRPLTLLAEKTPDNKRDMDTNEKNDDTYCNHQDTEGEVEKPPWHTHSWQTEWVLDHWATKTTTWTWKPVTAANDAKEHTHTIWA